MKKHGIIIEKGQKTQTKKIYNDGYLMISYSSQPFKINFKNKMVNDVNQHFAGGWSLKDMDLSNSALLKRVLEGDKPIGIIGEWEKKNLEQYLSEIDDRKFDCQELKFRKSGAHYLAIAPKGQLKNLFDLETLKQDYQNNGIHIEIKKAGEKELKDYFQDWDAQNSESKIELWETGLILGYPVENTISLYKDGIA